jgi:hypothetical protein
VTVYNRQTWDGYDGYRPHREIILDILSGLLEYIVPSFDLAEYM